MLPSGGLDDIMVVFRPVALKADYRRDWSAADAVSWDNPSKGREELAWSLFDYHSISTVNLANRWLSNMRPCLQACLEMSHWSTGGSSSCIFDGAQYFPTVSGTCKSVWLAACHGITEGLADRRLLEVLGELDTPPTQQLCHEHVHLHLQVLWPISPGVLVLPYGLMLGTCRHTLHHDTSLLVVKTSLIKEV